MNLFILILLIIYFPLSVYGQIDSSLWMVQADFGIEKHDKRLFGYSDKEYLLSLQPDKWGTYNYDVIVKRKISSGHKFYGYMGTGFNYELATFLRPFDHSYFMKDNFYVLRTEDNYKTLSIPLVLDGYFELKKPLYFDFGLTSKFLLYRKIDLTLVSSQDYPYTENTFELSSIEFTSGFNYVTKNVAFGVNVRLINYQKIDKILFNDIIDDPRIEQKWEFYNPLRIAISFSYLL